jgi:transposase
MDVVHPRCAGLDISKNDAKVCVRVAGSGRARATQTVTTWGATTNRILALREHLIEQRVSCVVMEATGDYWKPFYYLLEDLTGVEVMLVNARDAKNLPGRKTDVSDAAWLAQLGAHGLLRASFVPPEPIRELRDLTRTRTAITRERSREVQRLEKLLEDAGIKLSSVATDIVGVSGRAMLEALIAGQRDPVALADLAKLRLRNKTPQLVEALHGRFREHHAFLARTHLDLIDQHTEAITKLTARIEVVIEPFRGFREVICSIPGIGTVSADVITAETGADMTRFPTAGHLASWAGVCPGHHESAGRTKSTKTRPGNPYLKAVLGTAAMNAARNKDTYLGARYRRLAARRSKGKASSPSSTAFC